MNQTVKGYECIGEDCELAGCTDSIHGLSGAIRLRDINDDPMTPGEIEADKRANANVRAPWDEETTR